MTNSDACTCPDCVAQMDTPVNTLAADTTMVIAVSEMVALHQRLADTALVKNRIIKALQDLWVSATTNEDHAVQVLSETHLEELLGRDDARNLIYRIESVAQAAGIDWWEEVEQPAIQRYTDAVNHYWHLKFPSEESAALFSDRFQEALLTLITDGDLVPSSKYPLEQVILDPPRVEVRDGHPDRVVSKEYRKITGERTLSNITSGPNKWVAKYLSGDPDITVVENHSFVRPERLYPTDT